MIYAGKLPHVRMVRHGSEPLLE